MIKSRSKNYIVVQLEKRLGIAEHKFRLSRRRIRALRAVSLTIHRIVNFAIGKNETYFLIPIDDNAEAEFLPGRRDVFKFDDYVYPSPLPVK